MDNAPAPQHFANNSSLSRRAIGSVVVFVPTALTAWLGAPWFAAFILLVALLATREMIVLLRLGGHAPSAGIAFAALGVSFACAWWPALPGALAASVLGLGSLAWQMKRGTQHPIMDWTVSLIGGLYIGWCCGHLAALRGLSDGLWWLVLAVVTTWVADSGAYFIGKRFGAHPLSPTISPKKTWEGYIGGLLTGLACGAVIGCFAPFGMLHALAAAALVSALGTLGDLAESMFKRQANAKDSGTLIPGQGGAFDRIDSLMWAGVVTFFYAVFAAGALY